MKRMARIAAALIALSTVAFAICWFLTALPEEMLEPVGGGPLVLDRHGRPLLSLTDGEGQWSRPVRLTAVSPWLVKATIAVEDRRFFAHRGIDTIAVVRAAAQNVGQGRVVSGASTLTMQLCRMLDPRPRTFLAKGIESLRALKIERRLDKVEILERYLGLAPYGGNIRGAATASRIWFGKDVDDLSLPEAALLAGLPQSPTRLRPDRYPIRAAERRAMVLDAMLQASMIDESEFLSAVAEPVLVRPLENLSSRFSRTDGRHAAWMALAKRPAGGRTTIDLELQAVAEQLVRERIDTLPPSTDIAVVVIDVKAAAIRAMVGSADFDDPASGQVNGALALRSPGSTLKPFLFGAAFAAGRLSPDSPVPDRPLDRRGYRPQNFNPGSEGTVTAAEALRRSLNLPALRILEAVGLSRSTGTLEAVGVALGPDASARGGMALATGAIEVRLLDLTNAYATLARKGEHRPPRLFPDDPSPTRPALPAVVAENLNDILSSERRPPNGVDVSADTVLPWFMWKTGTSSGHRDALAVGHNGRFAVGVWAGRFSGGGHPEYTGALAAEPVLARLLTHPLLATTRRPTAPRPIAVRHPLFDREDDLTVLSPSPGTVLLARGEAAVVRPRANRERAGSWFLNGRQLAGGEEKRLALAAGRFVLVRVEEDGTAAASRFVVR
jgi:penicillin-binding protein 1C